MISIRSQKGFATLIIAISIMLLATIVTFATARVIVDDIKVFQNAYKKAVADNWAQAGFDYGIAYLNNDPAAVTDNLTTDGLTLTNTDNSDIPTNVTIYYSPIDTDGAIHFTATGRSADGESVRVVKAIFKTANGVTAAVPVPLVTRNNVRIRNNAEVNNPEGSQTIATSTLSESDFQMTYLGRLVTDFEGIADTRYPTSGEYTSNQNFNSQLDGVTGQTIYIQMRNNRRTTFNNGTFGSPSSPSTLVVRGRVDIASNAVIYGNVYATNRIDIENNAHVYGFVFSLARIRVQNNAQVTGGIAAHANIILRNNAEVTYSSSTLISTGATTSAGGDEPYGVLPGSWRDF